MPNYKLPLIITFVLLFNSSLFASEKVVDTTSGWKPYTGVPGADTASYYKISNCKFFEYDDYIVAERSLTGGEIGSDIFVKIRRKKFTEINCEKMSKNCAMKIMNKWAQFFLAKKGKYLIITDGTDERRGLFIYDITKGKNIFQSDFSEPIRFNYKSELSFWTESKKASSGECENYDKWKKQGLIPIIEMNAILDLNKIVLIHLTDTRCAYKKQHQNGYKLHLKQDKIYYE